MKQSTRWFIRAGAALAGILLAAGGTLLVPAVQERLFTRFVTQHLRTGNAAFFQDDALKVLLCGTSAPFADPTRAQSCIAVFANGKYCLVDAGPGSGRNLALWQLRGRELGAVFLTHFHSDHIGDLGEINTNAWLAGHPGPLPVYGGPGVERVVQGFNEAYAQDEAYRAGNTGAGLLPPAAARMRAITLPLAGPPTPQLNRRSAPLRLGGLTVTAFEVNHAPAAPAYAYRFDYRGRSVTISGDTRYHPPLVAAARGSDVLVHEAQSPRLAQLLQQSAARTGNARLAQLMGDIQAYHTDPADAARLANAAQVPLLVLTHLNPPPANPLTYRLFYRDLTRVRAKGWLSGVDGTFITLPPGSKEIIVSTRKP